MKRNLVIATLVVFACSSMFLVSSCAKKYLMEEEKEVKAAPAPAPSPKVVKREAPPEKARLKEKARLRQLELAKKREAESWMERRIANFEAEAIYFDFDKSFIRPEYKPVLGKKARFLKDNPDFKVRIEGNCDERGTNEYNLALGERRAASAKRFLISLGIGRDRIDTISYGEERPFALGHNEGSWAQNRRDDFLLIGK
jgi:peptidoglycan-associated lipoprotein